MEATTPVNHKPNSVTANGHDSEADPDNASAQPAQQEGAQPMSMNQFQQMCLRTRTPSCENADYPAHEIIEETWEFYDKFFQSLPEDVRSSDMQLRAIHTALKHAGQLAKARAKAVRRGEIADVIVETGSLQERREIQLEAFDILWGIAAFSEAQRFQLEDVAHAGLQKLADRQQRNVIVGDGDHR